MHLVCMSRSQFWSKKEALFLNIYFTYVLCINTEFGQGNPVRIPWTTLTFLIWFIFVHTAWGPKIKHQHLHFLLISFIQNFCFLAEELWDRTSTAPFYFNLFFHGLFELTMRILIEPPQPHFIFFILTLFFRLEVVSLILMRHTYFLLIFP